MRAGHTASVRSVCHVSFQCGGGEGFSELCAAAGPAPSGECWAVQNMKAFPFQCCEKKKSACQKNLVSTVSFTFFFLFFLALFFFCTCPEFFFFCRFLWFFRNLQQKMMETSWNDCPGGGQTSNKSSHSWRPSCKKSEMTWMKRKKKKKIVVNTFSRQPVDPLRGLGLYLDVQTPLATQTKL